MELHSIPCGLLARAERVTVDKEFGAEMEGQAEATFGRASQAVALQLSHSAADQTPGQVIAVMVIFLKNP